MGTTLNRSGYEKLIKEDIEWLLKQKRTLEQEHILCILEHQVELRYPTKLKELDKKINY